MEIQREQMITEPFNAQLHLHYGVKAVQASMRHYKIGITDDSDRRAKEYGDKYPFMRVLYRTDSASDVQ